MENKKMKSAARKKSGLLNDIAQRKKITGKNSGEIMGDEKPVVKIFWTGGWDSSFRICELSRMPVKIQPIYLHGDDRHSEKYEREAMAKITELLKERPETQAEFLDLQSVDIREIEIHPEVSAAYHRIHEKTGLGTQMEYLSSYVHDHPGIELGIEKLPLEESHMINALLTSCEVEEGDINGVHEFYINPEKSTEDGRLIFEGIYLPILDRTEQDMLKQIRDWGYLDIMKHVWFCHQPYNGRPCGMCHPCEVKMGADMLFLMPEDAQKRYWLQKKYHDKLWYKIYRKFLYLFFWKH